MVIASLARLRLSIRVHDFSQREAGSRLRVEPSRLIESSIRAQQAPFAVQDQDWAGRRVERRFTLISRQERTVRPIFIVGVEV